MPSEAKVPTYDKLLWPVLKAMKALGGSSTNDELLDKVIELKHFPDAVQNVMHTERLQGLNWATASRGLEPTSEKQARSKPLARGVGDYREGQRSYGEGG